MLMNMWHSGILLGVWLEFASALQSHDLLGNKLMTSASCRQNYGFSCDEVIGNDYSCPDLEALGWDCNGCSCRSQTTRVTDLAATQSALAPESSAESLRRTHTTRTTTTIEPPPTAAPTATPTATPTETPGENKIVWVVTLPDDEFRVSDYDSAAVKGAFAAGMATTLSERELSEITTNSIDVALNSTKPSASSLAEIDHVNGAITPSPSPSLTQVVEITFNIYPPAIVDERKVLAAINEITFVDDFVDNVNFEFCSAALAACDQTSPISPNHLSTRDAFVEKLPICSKMNGEEPSLAYRCLCGITLCQEELPFCDMVNDNTGTCTAQPEELRPRTTTSPPCDNSTGTCTVFEDPHINVFDGTQVSLLEIYSSPKRRVFLERGDSGDKWLVRSKSVSIQGRYMPRTDLPERNLFVRAVAIGGSFLNGNTLIIGSLEDEIAWNGKPILREQSSSFTVVDDNLFVNATRGEHSLLVEDLSKENPGVNVDLPMGVRLIANRLHQHVNVAITMPPQEGGQAGLCGNFNGVSSDDTLEFSTFRDEVNVHPEDSLFGGQRF